MKKHFLFQNVFIFLMALVALLPTPRANAAMSPLAVSVAPPVQFPPSDFDVTGARISLLMGKHRDVYGLDLGVVGNRTTGKFVGLGASGIFNYTEGDTTAIGMQFAGITNINMQKTHVYGLQLALAANYNKAESSVVGVQLALANLAGFTDIYGLQLGVFNKAKEVYGLQIGIVNVASNLHGLQIGVLNFNATGLFSVSPILNFGF